MGEIADKVDDVKLLVRMSKYTIEWASANTFRRIGFLLLISTILFGGWLWYITNLSNQVISEIDKATQQRSDLSKTNLYDYSIDIINLCIDATDKNSDLKGWYCSNALQQYKTRLSIKDLDKKQVKEIIDKKAYGAMKVDLLFKKRSIKYIELINKKPSKNQELLDWLLKGSIVFVILTFIFSLYCFVVYFLYKREFRVNNV